MLWVCDGCGRESEWTDDHMWYGSYKLWEDGARDSILVSCSNRCRGILERDGRIPADAPVLSSP